MNNSEIFRSKRAIVERIVWEAPGIRTFTLRLDEQYEATPGQFNMVYYWGIGEIPVSLADIPVRVEGYTLVEHTIKATGVVSRAIVQRLREGEILGLRGPYGKGWPLLEGNGLDLLIVAGGIGLAPLRPLIKHVEKHRESYGKLIIVYGARSPQDLLYKYEYESYTRIPETTLLLSTEKPDDSWGLHVGVVTDLLDIVDTRPESTIAYVCGPAAMMRTAVKKLLSKGFRRDRVYVSLERRMRCGVGICGTCQFGHFFVCKDGPVFAYSDIEDYFWVEGV